MIILAGILNIFIPLAILIQVVVALLLILVVLMQRPKQEGLGATFASGITDQAFGAQTTSVLQKATVWLAIIFVSNTVVLTILNNKQNTANAIAAPAVTQQEVAPAKDATPSLAEQLNTAEEVQSAPAAVKPAPASAPALTTPSQSQSILDQLNDAEEAGIAEEGAATEAAPAVVEEVAPATEPAPAAE